MKRIYKFVSLICVCLLSFNFLTVISTAGGTGTEADPFIITSAQELQNINNNVTAHYILGNDIDLADMDFTPIGNADSGAFSGSFDGNGYKISGLNVFSGKYAGLFGSNEGVVKNVILENIYVYGTRYIGGVVAQNTSLGIIESCSVLSGTVESDGGLNDINIGGICGINNGNFIGSFSNGAEVTGAATDVYVYAGGICGYWNTAKTQELSNSHNTGEISSSSSSLSSSNSYSGGLVGYAYSSLTVSGSYNMGNVSFSSYYSYSFSGGLVGYAYSTLTVSGSYNTGNVSSSSSSSNSHSGGLVGYAYSTLTVSGSYNMGNVSSSSLSSSYSGGLVGRGSGTISGSYNTGNVSSSYFSGGLVGYAYSTLTVSGSYNTGNVSSSSSFSGGLVGYAYSTLTVSGSYNTGNVSSSYSYSGGLVGYAYSSSTPTLFYSYSIKGSVVKGSSKSCYNGNVLSGADMKNASSFTDWNFQETWSMGGSVNTGYPVLKTTSSPLSLNVSNKVMTVGETLQLKAYKNGVETADVTWSVTSGCSNVSSRGVVTAASGLSTVTATDSEGNKANFNMYGYIKATWLVATDRTVKLGSAASSDNDYFTITGSGTDYIVDWQSSDNSVLEIDSNGWITPVSVGTAIVTATTAGGISAKQTVTVDALATGVKISSPNGSSVNISKSIQLIATLTPTSSTNTVSWSSSDNSVATVDASGKVTGVSVGTAVIIAQTDNGYFATYTVNVKSPVTEMAFESVSVTMYKGDTLKLKLKVSPTDTTDTISYKSSSTSCATVSSTGVVTAKNAGTTVITATASSGVEAVCVVTVKAWPSVLTVVDSATTINEDVITTDTTGVRNIERLVTAKDGYYMVAAPSYSNEYHSYYGTGSTVSVYDDYDNHIITYTLVVNGDVNGDSYCDVLDAATAERMSTDALAFNEMQAYASNGSAVETVDALSYQYVLNKSLSS